MAILEEKIQITRVSIQLVSPASGEQAQQKEDSKGLVDNVSIQLVSPASGEKIG